VKAKDISFTSLVTPLSLSPEGKDRVFAAYEARQSRPWRWRWIKLRYLVRVKRSSGFSVRHGRD